MGWKLRRIGHQSVSIKVPEIVGKQRARTVRVNGVTRSYTPKKTADFERTIRDAWIEHVGLEWAVFTGPVRISVHYHRELAKSNPKFWNGRADTKKPDSSNILKAVEDALNGIAYVDDSQAFETLCRAFPRVPYGCGDSLLIGIDYYEETYEKE